MVKICNALRRVAKMALLGYNENDRLPEANCVLKKERS